ncbi:MAG: hypothetical protein OXC07_08030 [Kistimonas sp.]|nr:hypothetical protein [Kistimonas sp.]
MLQTAVNTRHAPFFALAAVLGYMGRGVGVQYGPWIVNKVINMTVKKGLTRFLARQGAHLALGGVYPVVGQLAVTAALVAAPATLSATGQGARVAARITQKMATVTTNIIKAPQVDRERKVDYVNSQPAGGETMISPSYGKFNLSCQQEDKEKSIWLNVNYAECVPDQGLPEVKEACKAGYRAAADYLVVEPDKGRPVFEPQAGGGLVQSMPIMTVEGTGNSDKHRSVSSSV